MVVQLYTIFDKVAKEFAPLFEARNDAIAVRQVQGMFKKNRDELVNPDDYSLYLVGSFDRDEGKIEFLEKREIYVNLEGGK